VTLRLSTSHSVPRSSPKPAAEPVDPLSQLLDRAVAEAGKGAGPRRSDGEGPEMRALSTFLARHSHLPGPRPNAALLEAFAAACAVRGPAADRVAFALASLDADRAAGGTEFEFVPMCGVAAVGARAARERVFAADLVERLHAAADDLRYRVRAMVPEALARVGEVHGAALAEATGAWMDGYFHAAAVLEAIVTPVWLSHAPEAIVLERLDQGFALAEDAPRAAARYPGFKALLEVLARAPSIAAVRFGVPVFTMLEAWSTTKDPVLRDLVTTNVDAKRLAGRFSAEIARVRKAVAANTPAPRDIARKVEHTRGRGKKR
jgi:hypothetical protein